MIGLSPVYTVDNIFLPFVHEQGLFEFDDNGEAVETLGHKHELDSLLALNIERTGLRASQTCMGWALAVVLMARRSGRIEKPEGVTLGDKLLLLEQDVYSLFNYQFQVCTHRPTARCSGTASAFDHVLPRPCVFSLPRLLTLRHAAAAAAAAAAL